MKTIGSRLKEARTACRMSQDALAEKIGVSRGVITNIESGKVSSPQPIVISALCNALNIDKEWLLHGNDNASASSKTGVKSRIKQLRHSLDLTQQEFADRIGIKRNTIANYESGRNEPIDAVFSLICREFGVSESWLRTGEGEMFIQEDPDEEFMRAAKTIASSNSKEDQMIRRAILHLLEMDKTKKEAFVNFIEATAGISVKEEDAG